MSTVEEQLLNEAHDRLQCLVKSDGSGFKSEDERNADIHAAMYACLSAARALSEQRAHIERLVQALDNNR